MSTLKGLNAVVVMLMRDTGENQWSEFI